MITTNDDTIIGQTGHGYAATLFEREYCLRLCENVICGIDKARARMTQIGATDDRLSIVMGYDVYLRVIKAMPKQFLDDGGEPANLIVNRTKPVQFFGHDVIVSQHVQGFRMVIDLGDCM
jgi:hypothetical protein